MRSIESCAIKYPDVDKIPPSVCQDCKLRKLPDDNIKQCGFGNHNLKLLGYDL
jgi:hypothetical protein